MVDLTYDTVRGQADQAPVFVKRNPVADATKPDWGSQVIMAVAQAEKHSTVIEVLNDHYFLKRLDEEPKRIDKELGNLIYA